MRWRLEGVVCKSFSRKSSVSKEHQREYSSGNCMRKFWLEYSDGNWVGIKRILTTGLEDVLEFAETRGEIYLKLIGFSKKVTFYLIILVTASKLVGRFFFFKNYHDEPNLI